MLTRPLELYLPLYGVDLPGRVPGRSCDSRWEAIETALAARRFRFPGAKALDVGASLGYFTTAMALAGSQVDAVDTNRRLGAVIRLVALHNGVARRVRFRRLLLTNEFLRSPESRRRLRERYDVVLLLSVLQHVCHARGFDAARDFVALLSERTDFLVLELALASETHHRWSASLPDDPERFLEGQFSCGFERIGSGTDLARGRASVERPIYLGVNR